MSFLGAGLRLYNAALQRHPLATQIVSTGALWGLGDAIAQRVEKVPAYDLRRGLLTAAYGAAAVGPFGHAWYIGLDRMAKAWFVPGSAKFITFKVIADTAIFGPLHVLGYFTHMTLGEGGTWAEAKEKISKDFLPTFGAEVVIWPPLQTLNFKVVPVRYHLLFVNMVTIVDSTFMSWAASTDDWYHILFPALKKASAEPAALEKSQ